MSLINFIKHFVGVHPRLLLANLAGILGFLFLPDSLALFTRAVISWNVLAWSYLLLLWALVLRADNKKIQKIARIQDESASSVLMLICLGCIVSLLVIFVELSTAKDSIGLEKVVHLALTFSTLLGSWLLMPTAFAIHYAHLFYLAPQTAKPTTFPEGTSEPHYWDFIYFSFTIAVASQTADVSVCTTRARRLVTLQSILSFVFNLAILGLFINVSASLI